MSTQLTAQQTPTEKHKLHRTQCSFALLQQSVTVAAICTANN